MLCVLPGTLAEDEVQPLVDSVKKIVTEQGGSELTVEDQGKSRLAYPIKHIRYGYFSLFTFQAEAEHIPAIQAKLRMERQLLRSVITLFNPETREAMEKVMKKMQQKQHDYERGKKQEERKEDSKPAQSKPAVKEQKAEAVVSKTESKKVETVAEQAPASEEKAKEDIPVSAPVETKSEDVNLEDIDKKLDELLDKTLEDV